MNNPDFLTWLFQNAEEVKQDEELLILIHKIKEYDTPPYDDNDPYYLKYPWQKFGGVSSGICMAWHWYKDEVILEKATKEDIILALSELNKKRQK